MVDILILGAGWTSTFLIPLCHEHSITYAATNRLGTDSRIKFVFDPDSDDPAPYTVLPNAQTIIITFPIKKRSASSRLVSLYLKTRRGDVIRPNFMQLGSAGIWEPRNDQVWIDRHSPITESDRSKAEDELLALSSHETKTTVMNLSGLWGGARIPRNWVVRVAPSKAALAAKGSLHLIHGIDVARAIVAVHAAFDKAAGERWVVTDGRVYDWWDLASSWPTEGEKETAWVQELMAEQKVRGLPREVGQLGRALDSTEFWKTFNLGPRYTLLSQSV